MRILALCPRFPFPPDRGDRLHAYSLLRVFAHVHEVTLVAFKDGSEPAGAEAAIRSLGIEVHTVRLPRWLSYARVGSGLLSPHPLQVYYYRSRRMDRLVDRLSSHPFDIVFTQLIRMARYGLRARARRRILFMSDSLELAYRRRRGHLPTWIRPLVDLEADRVGRFERAMIPHFDRTWLVSDVDRAHFAEDLQSRIRVVPNGFPEEFLGYPLARPGRDTLLFVGHLRVPHNVDAARFLALQVLPRVVARRPSARALLVGADPAADVRRLARDPRIEVTGFVPDLGSAYREADIFVAPIRFGAGVQNKVVEAMAAGVPTVATTIVAQGMGAHAGRDLLAGDSAEELASLIVQLLEAPTAALELGQRGRAFVRARFGWERGLSGLEEAMEGVDPRR